MANLKVGNTNVGKISVIQPYEDVYVDAELPSEPWVRPSEWLDMPSISESDSRSDILLFVESGTSIGVDFYVQGYYVYYNNFPTYSSIDWGDGTSEVISGTSTQTQAKHDYDYENLSADTEFIYQGRVCRQALVQMVHHSGLYSMNLKGNGWRGTDYTGRNSYGNRLDGGGNILEVQIASQNLDNVQYMLYYYNSGKPKHLHKCTILSPNSITGADNLFHDANNLREVVFSSGLFSGNTNFGNMFTDCWELQSAPYIDTSSATAFQSMFSNNYKLREIPSYDTSNVINFSSMFYYCKSLTTIPELDYSNGENLSSLFSKCQSIRSIPSGLDFSSATNINAIFNDCVKLKYIPEDFFDQMSGVTTSSSMFTNCVNLNYIPKINLPNTQSLASAFSSCHSLKGLEFGAFNSPIDFSSLAYDCDHLKTVSFEDPENTRPTSLVNAFYSCGRLKDAPYLNTSGVTNFTGMFRASSNLENAPVYDISSATTIKQMFENCYRLKKFKGFTNKHRVDQLGDSYGAFWRCYDLEKFPSGIFEDHSTCPPTATNMFRNCDSLTSVPHINISGIINNTTLFYECSNIKYFEGLTVCPETNLIGLFNRCYALNSVPAINMSGISNLTSWLSSCQYVRWSDVYNVEVSHSYYGCHLGSGALAHIIGNLSSGVVGQTIDIRNNYGVAELHSDTLGVATSKGWTVTT